MIVERNTITEVCAPGEHRRYSAAGEQSAVWNFIYT